MSVCVLSGDLRSSDLQAAFAALKPLLSDALPSAPKQFYALDDLQTAFRALERPLSAAKEQGGLMNPWALASLGHDEVRNATALAGLWMPDFGGATSLRFAAAFLATAIPTVDWFMELAAGYRVATEVCPLGDRADRVDLIIETTHHLIGIEVKIRAGLGPDQLQRYSLAIARRAALQNLTPTVIFLALRPANVPAIASTSWINVARAARSAAGRKATERTFVQHLVATFGEHVQAF